MSAHKKTASASTRTLQMVFLVNADEQRRIKQRAGELGVSVAEMLRRCALGPQAQAEAPAPTRVPSHSTRTFRELAEEQAILDARAHRRK